MGGRLIPLRPTRSRLAIPTLVAAIVATTGVLVQSADAGSVGPTDASASSISANGRLVAFETGADFGGPVPPGATASVYVYDRERRRFELVSRRSKSAGGGGANGFSDSPAISANGRFVGFQSDADNLSAADAAVEDIYVYDRKRDRVELISRRSKSAGGQGQNAPAQPDISISASGRFVGFATTADNLGGPIDPAVIYHVYVYDRKQDRVQLISRRSEGAGGEGADGDSSRPSLSASGRFVAYDSGADNLSADADPTYFNVYVYDRKLRRVALSSRASGPEGPGGDDFSAGPSISADGRLVGFYTSADNLGGPLDTDVQNVYVYDRKLKRVKLVSRQSKAAGGAGADDNAFAPAIAGGGCCVVFATAADNLGGLLETDVQNIYVYDRKLKRVQLVSRRSKAAGGAGADDFSALPTLSADGRFAAFHTGATNLGGGSQLAGWDVYVYDRARRRIRLITGS